MATSANGWPALESNSSKLVTWIIDAKDGLTKLRVRNGSAGFLLTYAAWWFSENIEPLHGNLLDDWGHAYRPVRGQTTGLSNHASGTAVDMNATRHGRGVIGTFLFKVKYKAKWVTAKYRFNLFLNRRFKGTIRWGENYQSTVDGMHIEINADLPVVEARARALMDTPLGKRVLAANPAQRAVILS